MDWAEPGDELWVGRQASKSLGDVDDRGNLGVEVIAEVAVTVTVPQTRLRGVHRLVPKDRPRGVRRLVSKDRWRGMHRRATKAR
jgi:hypothetical protein